MEAEREMLKYKGEKLYSDSPVLKEIEDIRLKLNEMMAEDYRNKYDNVLMISQRLDMLLNEYISEKQNFNE